MKKHTIGQRLTIAFAALAVVTVISSVASLNMTRGLADRLDKAINVIGREQVLAGTLNTAAADMVASERGIAFSTVLQQFDKSS
jgi:CHASE3 domain sensor protein